MGHLSTLASTVAKRSAAVSSFYWGLVSLQSLELACKDAITSPLCQHHWNASPPVLLVLGQRLFNNRKKVMEREIYYYGQYCHQRVWAFECWTYAYVTVPGKTDHFVIISDFEIFMVLHCSAHFALHNGTIWFAMMTCSVILVYMLMPLTFCVIKLTSQWSIYTKRSRRKNTSACTDACGVYYLDACFLLHGQPLWLLRLCDKLPHLAQPWSPRSLNVASTWFEDL